MHTYLDLLLKRTIAFLAVGVFLCAAAYSSNHLSIVGDTERYHGYYMNLAYEPYPFKLEFVVNIFMHLSSILGGGFSFFVFIVFALWSGVVYWLCLRSFTSPLFFIMMLFFFTPYFFDNAVFLIRQYICVVFFIYAVFTRSRVVSLILAFLSLGSHSFFLYLWLVSRSRVSKMIFSTASRVVGGVLLIAVMLLHIDVGGVLVKTMYNSLGGMSWAIDRKLVGMMELVGEKDYALSPLVVGINFLVLLMFVFRGGKAVDEASPIRSLLSISLFSSFLFFIFLGLPVLANRLAFVTYFLSVPSLFFCMYYLAGHIGFKSFQQANS